MSSSEEKKIAQPPWTQPVGGQFTGLKVFNGLTQSKVDFIPKVGRRVTWYTCGPTVYDAAHMGHARNYITFDFIRRIMEEYFHYEVFYVMNITDVDDKIIVKGNRLLLGRLVSSMTTALASASSISAEDKKSVEDLLARARVIADDSAKNPAPVVLEAVSEVKALGTRLHLLTAEDIAIEAPFTEVARRFEGEFWEDMRTLGVRTPDVLTRVTEYVPEIVSFVERIIANGFAYESNGSVYFDVAAFSKSGHSYAKLEPWNVGSAERMAESEGALSLASGSEKRGGADFALWKRSKEGEPVWPSPWGPGRPGWHIECSAMAGDVLGEHMDIHSGGVDLRFPHHDNEIAQSEACFGCNQWVNYFIHAGHLNIDGLKMSKSLKNFVTIRDGLEEYSARQMRLLYLCHKWDGSLNYSRETMETAMTQEKFFNEFFQNVKAVLRAKADKEHSLDTLQRWSAADKELHVALMAAKSAVHESLCDNFNTAGAIDALKQLVYKTNPYLAKPEAEQRLPLLRSIAAYITHMFKIFGLLSEDEIGFSSNSSEVNLEASLTPFLNSFSTFRDQIRVQARAKADHSSLLKLCDDLRDDVLPELGVRLEDKGTGNAVWKLDDKETLLKERERKRALEAEKLAKKEAERKKQEEKERQKAIPPSELFKGNPDYTQFDERGIPTHDKEGKELSKKMRKFVESSYAKQAEGHAEWLAKQSSGGAAPSGAQ